MNQHSTLIAPQVKKSPVVTTLPKKRVVLKKVEKTKLSPLQIGILGSILFYIFANPEVFTVMDKLIPGIFKDFMGRITQTGTLIHSMIFGVVFFLSVYFIERDLLD